MKKEEKIKDNLAIKNNWLNALDDDLMLIKKHSTDNNNLIEKIKVMQISLRDLEFVVREIRLLEEIEA